MYIFKIRQFKFPISSPGTESVELFQFYIDDSFTIVELNFQSR